MNGAEYLEKVRTQGRLLQSCKDKVAQLEAQKDGLKSPSLDARVQTSGVKDISDALILIDDAIGDEIDALIHLMEMEKKARGIISLVPDANQQAVLRYRYLLYLPWKEIPDACHFSRSRAYAICQNGLSYLRRIQVGSISDKKVD